MGIRVPSCRQGIQGGGETVYIASRDVDPVRRHPFRKICQLCRFYFFGGYGSAWLSKYVPAKAT